MGKKSRAKTNFVHPYRVALAGGWGDHNFVNFLDDGYVSAMRTANRKHDVVAVVITDPRELEVPNVGMVNLADPETGRVSQYDTGSAAFRETFRRTARGRIERLSQSFGSSGIDFIHVDASGSVVEPLVRFFRMRERRMRR